MQKSCTQCSSAFEVTDADLAFYDKVSPVFGGKKYAIPAPTKCPRCRLQHRWMFRNERNLYKGICGLTGEEMITNIHPTSKFNTVLQQYIWDGTADPEIAAIDIDEKQSVFRQITKILLTVKHPNVLNTYNDNNNSDYCNCTSFVQNCYMVYDTSESENCMYSKFLIKSQHCVDCFSCNGCLHCYECIDCENCNNCYYLQECDNCYDSVLLRNCRNCHDCFGCSNLRGKEYYWLNQPIGKEEYKKRIAEYKNSSYTQIQTIAEEFKKITKNDIRCCMNTINCEEVSGNFITNSKNCKLCFSCIDSQDCFNCVSTEKATDCYDIQHTATAELSLEIMASVNPYMSAFSAWIIHCKNVYYCYLLNNCQDCFGCSGLQNKFSWRTKYDHHLGGVLKTVSKGLMDERYRFSPSRSY